MQSPFTAQVGSYDSTMSYDTLNSPSSPEAMLLNHEYADPVELRHDIRVELDKIDRKKKQNIIYEHTTDIQPKPMKNKKTSSKFRFRKCCIMFLFLVTSCTLALSLLTTLGIIATQKIKVEDIEFLKQKLIIETPDVLQKKDEKIHELESKIKTLQTKMEQIPLLSKQLGYLQTEFKNKTLQRGEKGDQGPPGPRGAGDLSQCQYKTEATTVSYHRDNPDVKTSAVTMWKSSSKDFTIMGVTCTTVGGSENGLFTHVDKGVRSYRCICAGKSKTISFIGKNVQCFMHYWECPINT